MTYWHIITGEYPPAAGGVADYTQHLARALAEAGDEVHVWAPPAHRPFAKEQTFAVHTLPDHLGPQSLVALAKGLGEGPSDRRILLQYVPQTLGLRGMNLPLCAALAMRREALWIMFHEVSLDLDRTKPLKVNVLAAVMRLMVRIVSLRANELFVSIPQWNERLPGRKKATWLPVPSNISRSPAPERVQELRETMSENGMLRLVGHFGTYGPGIADLLEEVLLSIFAAHAHCKAVLVGRNGPEFAAKLEAKHPRIRGRVMATGERSGDEIAACLSACDVLVQPYPDGISSRRGSAMAGLALGLPTVANEGALSESMWRGDGSVALADASPSPRAVAEQMAQLTRELLEDGDRAAALGARARALYDRFFSLERTVRTLRLPAASVRS